MSPQDLKRAARWINALLTEIGNNGDLGEYYSEEDMNEMEELIRKLNKASGE